MGLSAWPTARASNSTRIRASRLISVSIAVACAFRKEAVFNVAHGDPRPFKVLVSQGTLRDIGTAF
jgi:hypothetical protein